VRYISFALVFVCAILCGCREPVVRNWCVKETLTRGGILQYEIGYVALVDEPTGRIYLAREGDFKSWEKFKTREEAEYCLNNHYNKKK